MIKVTCQLEDYSSPAMPCIKVHNNWISKRQVELEVDGKRYTVTEMYEELITNLRNCAETNSLSRYKRDLMKQAADAIEELSREIDIDNAAMTAMDAAMPRWIPVTERLPKYGERVFVFGGVTMYVAYYDKNRYGGESWHKLNSKNHYCNPTHWMPLPEPPKEET